MWRRARRRWRKEGESESISRCSNRFCLLIANYRGSDIQIVNRDAMSNSTAASIALFMSR